MIYRAYKNILFSFIIFISIPLYANNLSNSEQNNTSDVLVNVISQQWLGDFDVMKKKRVIRILIVPSKIMYHISNGKKSGIAYEMIKLFEKHLNTQYDSKKNDLKLHVVFMPIARDKLIPALIEGRADIIIGALAITPKRKEVVDFSDPFFTGIDEIIVTSKSMPELKNIQDLAGKEIFVRPSSSYWEYLEKLNLSFTEQNLSLITLTPAPEVLEDEDLMEMVNANLISMIVVDNYKAKLWSKILPNMVIYENITIKKNDKFAWMIRKNSPLLRKEINNFVPTHKEGTLLGNILKTRYVKKYSFINNALTKKELSKFYSVVNLFKKYSKQYDIPYLLMLAQGYQESKLNQKAKSHVGAIGIMQLMPSTGKSMKVGDIHKIEPNIHAGIKYHRWLEDRYFKDANMTNLDKALFTFAAYNAGPARIRELRNETKKRGLNPDIWIDNVELITSEKIGAETVTYVANIFKYYIAYKLYSETELRRKNVKKDLLKQIEK